MAELNYIVLLVVGDMFPKDHVLIEIASIKYACRKSNFFDVCVDMIFSFVYLRDKTAS